MLKKYVHSIQGSWQNLRCRPFVSNIGKTLHRLRGGSPIRGRMLIITKILAMCELDGNCEAWFCQLPKKPKRWLGSGSEKSPLRMDFSALRLAASWHLLFSVQYRSCPVRDIPLTSVNMRHDNASIKAAYATALAFKSYAHTTFRLDCKLTHNFV